jgi:oligoendopeptidase F
MTPYTLSPWNLSDLLRDPNGAEVSDLLARMEENTRTIEGIRPQLSETLESQVFNQLLDCEAAIVHDANRLLGYGALWFSGNTQDATALAFNGKYRQLLTDLQNRTLFFGLWWKEISETSAQRLLAGAPESVRYSLHHQRLFKPFTLAEKIEQVINIKDSNGSSALTTIYAMLTNAYKFTLEVDGERKELTREGLSPYIQGDSAELREAAYRELYRVYAEDGTVLAQIYTHLVRDYYQENIQLRGHQHPLGVRNLANDLPDAVIDTLLEVIRQNTPIFRRWFELKARLLGVETLRRYDLYAPLRKSDKAFEYDTAVQNVLQAFADFSPRIAKLAQRVFDEQHVDSEVRAGKRGGAFCMSLFPEGTPYVLLNYTGKARSVATLAHELGHAIHAMLASQHSIFTFHSALPLAETASTFSEMLLTDMLLQNETDTSVRRDLIASLLDDAYATIQRQAFFVLFERQAHQMIRDGASVGELNAAYLANLREQFGESIAVSDEFQWEWVSIPHIYNSPFYCYAYAFGQLLVFALYQQYKQLGKAQFEPKLVQILAAGGSASPLEILDSAGIDIRPASFWQGAFDFLSQQMDVLANE